MYRITRPTLSLFSLSFCSRQRKDPRRRASWEMMRQGIANILISGRNFQAFSRKCITSWRGREGMQTGDTILPLIFDNDNKQMRKKREELKTGYFGFPSDLHIRSRIFHLSCVRVYRASSTSRTKTTYRFIICCIIYRKYRTPFFLED